MTQDPLRGALFENLVILELMKYRENLGMAPNLYFYRDNHKNEVDVIVKYGHELVPIEIKSAETFHSHFMKNVKYYKKINQDRSEKGYVIYSGLTEQSVQDVKIINYRNTSKIWRDIQKESGD